MVKITTKTNPNKLILLNRDSILFFRIFLVAIIEQIVDAGNMP